MKIKRLGNYTGWSRVYKEMTPFKEKTPKCQVTLAPPSIALLTPTTTSRTKESSLRLNMIYNLRVGLNKQHNKQVIHNFYHFCQKRNLGRFLEHWVIQHGANVFHVTIA